jgi:ferritin-like metal-binding protein YciE
MKTLQDLFLDQLSDMYDAEQRIVRALPKMAKAATCAKLQTALQDHLRETEGQITKLEQAFESVGHKPEAQKCKATVGILDEGDEMASDFKGSPAINAAVIAACQKVEHYEIATYGCLREWAQTLGYDEAAGLIEEILEEEKAADDTLTDLAHAKNEEARAEVASSDSER